jgi:hypothetical protein
MGQIWISSQIVWTLIKFQKVIYELVQASTSFASFLALLIAPHSLSSSLGSSHLTFVQPFFCLKFWPIFLQPLPMSRFNIERAIFLPCHEPCFQLTSLCFQPPPHHIPKAHHRKIIVYILKFLINRIALNFSNDVGSWCSHSMTLTSKIQRISVLYHLIPNILPITPSI